jgi:DNA-binding MarR family transcriptional regulator
VAQIKGQEGTVGARRFHLEENPGFLFGFLFGRLRARMEVALGAEVAGLDITPTQCGVLVRLASGMGRTSAELCRTSNSDMGSMAHMLDRMQEKQLITRERSTEDRRVVEIRMTEHAWEIYPQILDAGQRMLDRASVGFTPEELEQFEHLLRRTLGNLAPDELPT